MIVLIAGVILAGAASVASGEDGAPLNRIQLENALPGDTGWYPSALPASDPTVGQIEGYASPVSVNIGETIKFYVSTQDPSYTATIYRAGWYGGAGARQMAPAGEFPGSYHHNDVYADLATGLVEARDWPVAYSLTIPPYWTSGIYAVRLISSGETTGTPYLGYIFFVVRDDHRASDIMVQASVNTYQAYNNWGGKSLYASNSVGGTPAVKVSFNRPYANSWGFGDFAAWETNFLRFVEKEGYDVTYSTNIDTDRNGLFLKLHRAFLSVGHDEYWSAAMRQNVEVLRNLGISLGFFGANACYWQIRYEDSPVTGDSYRTIVAYKETAATTDPVALDDNPGDDSAITTRWRDTILGHSARPEDGLIGVKSHAALLNNNDGLPIVITVPTDEPYQWVFSGTGLAAGDSAVLPGLLGYETDSASDPDSAPPSGTTILARSPDPAGFSNVTIYRWSRGWNFWGPPATVFAVGSMNWSHGLDDSSLDGAHLANPIAQQMTRNVLDCFVGKPVCQPPGP